MVLVTQNSFWPTRKVWAMIISGALMGIIQSLLANYWPDHPFADQMVNLDIWLQGTIMAVAAYMYREKA